MAVELTVEPAAPAPGDGILITVRGEVEEGSTIAVTSDGDELQESPPFGIGIEPEGTGPEALTLKIVGGSGGHFSLSVRDPDISDPTYYETDPIYYDEDAPTYTYPDVDDVIEAFEDVVPEGVTVDARKVGNTMTILFGGKWSGKNVGMTIDAADIVGSETSTLADVTSTGGPFTFGPLYLEEGDYEIVLKDPDGVQIGAPKALTVED